MGTRIKSIEITTANLVGEKTHLMAEVDKLRDQRARLEQVGTLHNRIYSAKYAPHPKKNP